MASAIYIIACMARRHGFRRVVVPWRKGRRCHPNRLPDVLVKHVLIAGDLLAGSSAESLAERVIKTVSGTAVSAQVLVFSPPSVGEASCDV